jgi:hypothetical protein
MNPREFQDLATKLANGDSPAEFRTAVSRAYYSVFNVGVEIMKGMGFHISENPGGHGELEHRLSNSKHIEIEKVGSQLGDLRSRRIQADYRLERREVETRKNAQALVQQASAMITVLDRCCTGPDRPKIVEGIREYLGKLSQTH